MRARFAEISKIFSLSTTMKTRGNPLRAMQVTRDWSARHAAYVVPVGRPESDQRCQRSMIHCVTEGR